MLTETLKIIFGRDLKALKSEIESYNNEANIWLTDKSIANSAGNLCLHIAGSLNWFIGAQFGNTGYIRKRDHEFSAKNISRADLLSEIDKTMSMINDSLSQIKEEQLENPFPISFKDLKLTTSQFLIHLTTHTAYHLGQINYHRRLLDE